MKAITWEQVTIPIDELIHADYNPRKMTEKERTDLEDSIREFGPVVPVVVNIGKRKNVLVGGHQRSTIYKEMGYETVTALRPNRELTLEEEKRLNLRLNKNTGSWDFEKLKNMDLVVLLDVGFDDDDLQVFFDDVEMFDDGFEGPGKKHEEEDPITQPGQVWQLGDHRVMCGNATSEEDVKKLMGGNLADVLWMDPPLKLDNSLTEVLKGEKNVDGKYATFLNEAILVAMTVAKPHFHTFLWCDEVNIWMAQTLLAEHKHDNKRVLIWVKPDMQVTPKVAFNKAYESCVYATKGKPYLNPHIKNYQQVLNREVNSGNQIQEDIMDLFDIAIDRKEKPGEYSLGTAKPVTLNERPLKRCTAPGHIVLDLFGGSGSMLVACQQVKRLCYTMEKDPKRVDLIVKRWEELTNQKAKAL